MKLSAAVSTVGQGEELDGLEERAKISPALPNYTSKILLMNSVTTISFLVFRPMQFMRTNIYLGTSMARPGIAKKLG